MAATESVEMQAVRKFVESSEPEMTIENKAACISQDASLVIIEGFEERSIGLLRRCADIGCRLSEVILGRYIGDLDTDLNAEYREEFERLISKVGVNTHICELPNSGLAVGEMVQAAKSNRVILDISALTTRGIFAGLDRACALKDRVIVGYSEAAEYHPTASEWAELKQKVTGDIDEASRLAELADDEPWLYSGAHNVELIAGHEGFDAAGSCALAAFLPFKSARLAAVIHEQEYNDYLFIGGRPRLEENAWRLEALREVNAQVTRGWRVVDIDTFGYQSTLIGLANELCGEGNLLEKYDVHLAPMGSKLQKVACWALSSIVRSMTLVTAVPQIYFPEAFSHGVGETWIFRIVDPRPVQKV